jgi:transcriptional regulator with XRE-family HTH domain
MKSKILQQIEDETPKYVEIFVEKYADLVLRINQILQQKGISQNDLAQKLEKQPSEISKWLNNQHNFTLRSIAKLEAELGETLLEVPKFTTIEYEDGYIRQEHKIVSYRKVNSSEIDWQQINSLRDVG